MKVPHVRPAPEVDGAGTSRLWWWVGGTAAAVALALGAWVYLSVDRADPEVVWKQAEAALQADRFDEAEAGMKRLAKLRAPTPFDMMLRAQVAMVRNQPDQVLADLAAVPDDHPLAPQARLLAGQFVLRLKRPRQAEGFFKEAIRLKPDLVQAHRELIYIYGMLLRRPELNAEFRRLGEIAPLTFDNIFHWCLTRNSVWEAKEITEELRSYVAADKDDRASRLALADNLRQIGQPGEAVKVLEPLPKSDPEAVVLRARMAMDRNDDAALQQVLAEGPEGDAELERFRGRLALARRDGPEALRHFRLAYKANPDHRDAVAGLGQALAMTGDAAAAAPYLAAARDHDQFATLMQRAATDAARRDPELWRSLGAACEKLRRYPEARAWYNLIIERDPLDAEAQKSIARVERLIKEGKTIGAAATAPGS